MSTFHRSLTLHAVILSVACQLRVPPIDPTASAEFQRQSTIAEQAGMAERLAGDARHRHEQTLLFAQRSIDDSRAARRGVEEAHAAAVDAANEYADALARANELRESCSRGETSGATPEEVSTVGAHLLQFESTSARDAALVGLESCRLLLIRLERANFKANLAELRVDFAAELEDTYDEENPISRGNLKARVKGRTLAVAMKGNFEGRARHSRTQIDDWCSSADFLFDLITLANAHGSFKCRPPRSADEFFSELLVSARLTSSWKSAPPGKASTPELPAPLSPTVGDTTFLYTSVSETRSLLSAAGTNERNARIRRVTAEHAASEVRAARKNELTVWRDSEASGAKRLVVGGAAAGLAGIALAAVGVGSIFASRKSANRLDDAQRRNDEEMSARSSAQLGQIEKEHQLNRGLMFAGLALGSALVVIGVPMFFVGRERQRLLRRFVIDDHIGLRF